MQCIAWSLFTEIHSPVYYSGNVRYVVNLKEDGVDWLKWEVASKLHMECAYLSLLL